MHPHADSAEFDRLLDRWLDDSATAAEAKLFWRYVTEREDCAREFAAAARFEGLLADTIKARDVEAEARKILTVTPRMTVAGKTSMLVAAAPVRPAQPTSLRGFAIAAGLMVAGLITAMLWPSATVRPEVVQQTPKASVKPIASPVLPDFQKTSPAPMPPLESPALPAGATQPVEVTLIERLDRFFINGVLLDNVPLGQALALLQQQLVQTDYLKTLPLSALRVTVPAGATARRVSFQSESIPYLKAVRAVAALAGCDVQVDGLSITLILQPGTFPQVVERRALADLLAGRLSRDGTAMIQDEGRVAALWEDAALLGIATAEDGTANLSRGQWEALRTMTDARDQMGLFVLPAFALYVVPQESVPQEGVLTPDQTLQFQQNAGQAGIQPVASVTPNLAAPQDDILLASATGNDINIGPEPDVGTNSTSGILRRTGAVLTLDSTGTVSAGLVMNLANLVIRDQAVMAAINAIQNTGSAAVIIAVPVQPTTPP